MSDAREIAKSEVERMLAELKMKPSPFAKAAGLYPTTLTRFLRDPNAPVLTTSTLSKLRETRDQLLRDRQTLPRFDQLTKDPDKRALLAMLETATKDEVAAMIKAARSLPKPFPPSRKRDDNVGG